MATRSALDTLIELATTETAEAAKRLGMAIKATEEAERKLAMLQEYRTEYSVRFENTMATGLSAAGYRNFQLFMNKLDTAISGQMEIVKEAKKRVDERTRAWQADERKRMSYDTLSIRAQQTELKIENKRDQKLMDEHAARQYIYKN
jgi:flagellar FliJ protein